MKIILITTLIILINLIYFQNKSLDKSPSLYYGSQQPVPTEMDFSNLLAVMANEKQKLSNSINNNNNNNEKNPIVITST